MRKIRVAAAATTLSLVGAMSSLGSAGAAAPAGVGTTEAVTTVLGVALGSGGELLDLRLLDDIARSTTDSKVNAVPEAFSRLSALKLTSAVPALNKSVPETAFEARTPGGKSSDGAPGASLGGTLPLGVVSGTVDAASLTSLVDGNGARSALTGAIGELSAVGGLLSLKGLSTQLTTSAAPTVSDGTRLVKLDSIDVLDLGSLLNGLGIDLLDLAPSQLTGLLDGLDLDVANIGDAAAVQGLIDSVQGQITSLTAQLPSLTAPLSGSAINSIVGSLPVGGLLPTSTVTGLVNTTNAVTQVNGLIDSLQVVLGDVLGSVLGTLDGASLLTVGASEFGILTKATDTVAGSVAEVTAKLGNVSIGGVNLPGVDVGSTVAQVTGLLDTVNGTLGSVLGAVNPGLANLVTVSVLDQVKDITSVGGYTKAKAGITGLTAKIVPPLDLAGIVSGIAGQDALGLSAGSLIPASSRSALPTLDPAMGVLNTALGTVQALAGGATLTVGQLLGTSEFAPAAALTSTSTGTAAQPVNAPGGTLPRTGQSGLQLAAIGALLVALGLGFRSWLRMPGLHN